ncbi:MAG: hypothetical protein ACAI25_13570 [Planctomycetota bacterium]
MRRISTAVLPPVALALGLVVLFARPACAGDEEVDLVLLPKAKKGVAEEIKFEVHASYGTESEQLTGKMKREIRAVDDDGLPSSEIVQLYNADYRHQQAGSSYGTSANSRGAQTIKRSGKARTASTALADLSHVTFKHVKDVTGYLNKDPDALVRAIQPDEKMKVDDRWEVEAKDLLVHFVGPKAKLIEEGTKAVATLENLRKKDDKLEASISLKATSHNTPADDPDTQRKITIKATLKGPADGSAPPRKTDVDVVFREGEEKKFTQRVVFERTPAEKDEEEEPKADEKPKKVKKKVPEKAPADEE